MSEPLSPETATLEQVAAAVCRLRERVEDLEDLRDLNAAMERNAGKPGVPWETVCQEFGWDFKRQPGPGHDKSKA